MFILTLSLLSFVFSLKIPFFKLKLNNNNTPFCSLFPTWTFLLPSVPSPSPKTSGQEVRNQAGWPTRCDHVPINRRDEVGNVNEMLVCFSCVRFSWRREWAIVWCFLVEESGDWRLGVDWCGMGSKKLAKFIGSKVCGVN